MSSSSNACALSVPGDGIVPHPADTAEYSVVDGLYMRPEATAVDLVGINDGVANRYVEPFSGALGGRFLLFHSGDFVTIKGQGYFLLRWEMGYFNRGGVVTADVAPSFNVSAGVLKKVALTTRYMPDYAFDDTPGQSGIWRPGWAKANPDAEYIPFTTPAGVTEGVPSLWANEYYYIDGQVTITNREGGADYNVAITPVSWQNVHDALVGTSLRTWSTSVRSGISLDPYNGASKPSSPGNLAVKPVSSSMVKLTWETCSNNHKGTIVEYSWGGFFGEDPWVRGKTYAAGELYTTAETLAADSKSLEFGTLKSGTHYFFRAKTYNDAGDSAYSNVVEVTTPLDGVLPSPWLSTDISVDGTTISTTGQTSYANGVFALQVGSKDLWGGSDSFHFVYQTLDGDGSITARLIDASYTHQFAKTGVMIRESLNADSNYMMSRIQPSGGISGQRRQTTGGATFGEGWMAGTPPGSNPCWLRVTRRGNIFIAEASFDNVNWTTLSSRPITMASKIYVGLALATTSGREGVSSFDSVSITNP